MHDDLLAGDLGRLGTVVATIADRHRLGIEQAVRRGQDPTIADDRAAAEPDLVGIGAVDPHLTGILTILPRLSAAYHVDVGLAERLTMQATAEINKQQQLTGKHRNSRHVKLSDNPRLAMVEGLLGGE